MQYKPLGDSGVSVSAISIGSMRFANAQSAEQIIHRAMDLGINYIDTSTGYVGGKSEIWSGAGVAKRRDEMFFSSKCGFDKSPDADSVRANIEKSLTACGLDYFDFYQLWGLTRQEMLDAALARGGFIEGVRKAQRDGLIRHGLGFTFHGSPELFRAAIDTREFCCATLSYNLMSRDEEANIAYAAEHGVATIIMNPLAGGVLALSGHPAVDCLRRDQAGPWWGAMRFLHANPAITTSIVGFTAAEQIDQIVGTLNDTDELDESYRAALAEAMSDARFIEGHFCTACGYCKDCPHGFNPSKFMQVMRDFAVYAVADDDLRHWITSKYAHQNIYELIVKCTECGECEAKCPQHLGIVEQIRRGKQALGL